MHRYLKVVACCLALSGCGNTKTIGGITYATFGLADESEKRNPAIEYEVSVGSIVAAIFFMETIVVPVYVLLFDLYQPVGPKPAIIGQVTK